MLINIRPTSRLFPIFSLQLRPVEQFCPYSSPSLCTSLLDSQENRKENNVQVSSLYLAVSLSLSLGFTKK